MAHENSPSQGECVSHVPESQAASGVGPLTPSLLQQQLAPVRSSSVQCQGTPAPALARTTRGAPGSKRVGKRRPRGERGRPLRGSRRSKHLHPSAGWNDYWKHEQLCYCVWVRLCRFTVHEKGVSILRNCTEKHRTALESSRPFIYNWWVYCDVHRTCVNEDLRSDQRRNQNQQWVGGNRSKGWDGALSGRPVELSNHRV